jgi:hypothetical protein
MSTTQKHGFSLEDRDYTAVELSELIGRHKSRINQLAREFNLGRLEPQGHMVFRKIPREDVDWLLNWLIDNGISRSRRAKSVQESQFGGRSRFDK